MLDLFPYQRDAVDHITANGHPTYVAYEMGLGKSAIALETAKRKGVKRLLILCPAVGRLSWKREFARWWPKIPLTIVTGWQDTRDMDRDGAYVVPYSLISTSKSGGFDYTETIFKKKPFDMTVLDEAHALKNPGAIRTQAVLKKLLPKLGFVLPMSGTPTPNHQGELFPILRTVFPETLRKTDGTLMLQHEFESAYCYVSEKKFSKNRSPVRVVEGSRNIEDLRKRLAPYVIRKRKKDVLTELPDMTFDIYPVEVSDPHGLVIAGTSGTSDDDLMATLTAKDQHIMRLRRQIGIAKVAPTIIAIDQFMEGSRRKCLVFAHHTDVIDLLMAGLIHYGPVRLDGRDSPRARDIAIQTFLTNPSCRVFVGQTQAAGSSITLVGPGMEVSDVFFVEADFSPGNNVQAASRIHRIGQKDAVQVWFMTAEGTLDDRIQDILARKTRDFHQLFDQGSKP